jgi:vancomycin resistance protein VanJ
MPKNKAMDWIGRVIKVDRFGEGRRPFGVSRGLGPACWAYLAATTAVWLAFLVGDEWLWPVTILLYAPRWPWALPLAILTPASAGFRPRSLVPLALSAGVVLGPILGFCISPPSSWGETSDAPVFRMMTLNTQGGHFDPALLRDLIAQSWPDLVVLQEWSGRDALSAFPGKGWEVRESFGLCLVSRLPILRDEALPPVVLNYLGRAARYEILVHGRIVRVANIHLATPRVGLEAILDDWRGGVETLREGNRLRRCQSELVNRWVSDTSDPLIVAGDFNLPPDASIFRASWQGFADTFKEAGFGFGQTKFTRWHGVRIDYILAGPGWCPRRCWVGPDVGSDHCPVLADLEFRPG